MNQDIKRLHQQLAQSHQVLLRRFAEANNDEDAETILWEIEEVNFRMVMTGRLLFKQTPTNFSKDIQSLIDAGADLDRAIQEARQIKDIVNAVGQMLTFVDTILDKLKLL